MPAKTKTRHALPPSYVRPSEAAFDELLDTGPRNKTDSTPPGNPGVPATAGTADVAGSPDVQVVPGDSGVGVVSGTADVAGSPDVQVVPGDSGVGVVLGTADVAGTADANGYSVAPGTADVEDASEAPVTRGAPGNSVVLPAGEPSAKKAVELRDHVKLRRSLAVEMRDAVWFLSEHGRPRVQLVEILDEAVGEWLEKQKAQHNEGRDFPHRGGLR